MREGTYVYLTTDSWVLQVALVVKKKKKTHLPLQETKYTQVLSLGDEEPLEEDTATHCSVLAWRIPWTEEPGWLGSIGSQSRT